MPYGVAMPAEVGMAAAEEAANGRNFPVAGASVPGASRGGSGRHSSSSHQQHRGLAAGASASFGRLSLLQEMRALQEKLEADIYHLEGKIHEMETDYLAAPAEVGNMIKGWEGYVSTGTKTRRLPTKAAGNSTGGAAERLFSLTSCTSQAWKELGPWTDNDVLQPAPAPVSSSSWGNSSSTSAVVHASGSGQRHGGGGGGGSSVVRAGKRSHAKSSSHGKGSSRKSTAKTHAALGETKSEGRGDYIDEHGRGERSASGTASDSRCV